MENKYFSNLTDKLRRIEIFFIVLETAVIIEVLKVYYFTNNRLYTAQNVTTYNTTVIDETVFIGRRIKHINTYKIKCVKVKYE